MGFVRWPALRRDWVALVAAVLAPLLVTALLVPFRTSFPNTDAALVLVAVVVAVAANGNRLAGYLAALSSAVWFDFFLTHPYERFTISRSTDIETTLLVLAIGVAVTELAVWGRRQHAAASLRAGYLNGIHAAAETALTNGDSAVIAQVTEQLTRVLDLSSCQFQFGVAGLGASARLNHDGRITLQGAPWSTDAQGLPRNGNIELLVHGGGSLQGRFLMTATTESRPSLEKRLVAAALADQVGAALARQPSSHR